MAKYSTEYKLKMVREYLAGQGGYRALSKRHEITESQIELYRNSNFKYAPLRIEAADTAPTRERSVS